MDNLLCDESWLLDPPTPEPLPNFHLSTHNDHNVAAMISPAMDAAKVEEAISMDLEKELCYCNNNGDKFVECFVSKKLTEARSQTVQWLIQTRNRLNLSFETLFSAANCFDRFVYVSSCDEWTNWMVELVTMTSLSIASKFNEVTSPTLEELQMYDLNHMFNYNTVLEMELIMLRALEWRVNSVTSLSFSQIFVSKIGLTGNHMLMNRITDHLLDDLYDLKMLQYSPSIVAVAAMWNVLDQEKAVRDENIGILMNLFGQEHKEKIVKCVNVMKSRNMDHWMLGRKSFEVKSLLSALKRVEIKNNGNYHGEDLSAIFQILRSEGSDKKRERDGNHQDQIRPAKRKTFVMSK
ncbi:putative cyclin-D7-1 [Cardamine amara subsp. amara]|uniref:Cyclin-D7-1 n=1 Tax=Cardamine amara subsp. amara TaxID=228776 RepID=A0ABD1A1T5_CARAN